MCQTSPNFWTHILLLVNGILPKEGNLVTMKHVHNYQRTTWEVCDSSFPISNVSCQGSLKRSCKYQGVFQLCLRYGKFVIAAVIQGTLVRHVR